MSDQATTTREPTTKGKLNDLADWISLGGGWDGAHPGLDLCDSIGADLDRTLSLLDEMGTVLKGMMEIAETAMPSSFFQSDSRVQATRAALSRYHAMRDKDASEVPGR